MITVIDLIAAEHIHVRGNPAYISVVTTNDIRLDSSEIGFVLPKRGMQEEGIYAQSGIIHPGWSGRISVVLMVWGETRIIPGDKVAHAVILTLEGGEQ